MTPIRLTDQGWHVAHPPAAERAWTVDSALGISTGEALWWLGEHVDVWPITGVTALANGEKTLLKTPDGRCFLGEAPPSPLRRMGLHTTATWQGEWQIEGLSLPIGAQEAPDLQPLVRGLGATWTSEEQPFAYTTQGIRATRQRTETWDPVSPRPDLVHVGVALSGPLLWGPGHRVWDLRTGISHPLPAWSEGLAAAHTLGAAVVQPETGAGLLLGHNAPVRPFQVPLRNDSVAALHFDGTDIIVTTELGRRLCVHKEGVRRISGRVLPVAEEPITLPNTKLWLDGLTRVNGVTWAWRRDGLLLRSLG